MIGPASSPEASITSSPLETVDGQHVVRFGEEDVDIGAQPIDGDGVGIRVHVMWSPPLRAVDNNVVHLSVALGIGRHCAEPDVRPR